MAVKKILLFGDSKLEKVSLRVEKVDNEIIEIINNLRDTLRKADGVGLAAPQIGVLKKVIFIDLRDGSEEIVLINPKIIKRTGKEKNAEGCLSYPGYEGIVERPKRVTVCGMDRYGNAVEIMGEGLLARALCHEVDHLEGVLYTQKAKKIYRIDTENE